MSDHANEETGRFGRRDGPPIVPKTANEALRPETGVPPPRRSRHARNRFVVFLNFVVTSAVLLVIAAGFAVYFGKMRFDEPGPVQVSTNFVVKKNATLPEIAEGLENRGLISDSRVFSLGVRAYGNDTSLKSGEYALKAGASMRDIMELLKSGRSVLYSLTIPEGLTVAQAFARIAENEILTGPMPGEQPPEGSLITDTLRFQRGTSRMEIVEKLKLDQQRMVEAIWARRAPDLPINTIEEFVTLASIVEKETGRADERGRVAAVFINRLRKGMRLQSDPTIVYGLFGGNGKPPDRPIYKSDIEKPTPYNTYTIDGLPPTPIANPGRAALEAVANPSKTDELYFVANGTGGHVFAKTLDEHNENVRLWRKIEAERQAAETAAKTQENSAGTSQSDQ